MCVCVHACAPKVEGTKFTTCVVDVCVRDCFVLLVLFLVFFYWWAFNMSTTKQSLYIRNMMFRHQQVQKGRHSFDLNGLHYRTEVNNRFWWAPAIT